MSESKDGATGSTANDEIEIKLRLLKKDSITGPIPTEEEIGERLAQLKDLPAKHYTATHTLIYKPPVNVSAVQQADNLINQFQSEIEIDSKRLKPEEEIEQRLKLLRKDWPLKDKPMKMVDSGELKETAKDFDDQEDDSESEDLKVDQIVQQFLKQASLDVKTESGIVEDDSIKSPADCEELPWCVICNEDARVRCPQCSNDLYCMQCFKEFHEDEDNHKPVSFKRPKNKDCP